MVDEGDQLLHADGSDSDMRRTDEVRVTPSKNPLSEDHIEDYSENEEASSSAPLPVIRTPPGVAGRFASYLGAKGSGNRHRSQADAEQQQREPPGSGDLISTTGTGDAAASSTQVERKQRRIVPEGLPARLEDRLEQVAGIGGEAQASPDAQIEDTLNSFSSMETQPASLEALRAAGHAPEPDQLLIEPLSHLTDAGCLSPANQLAAADSAALKHVVEDEWHSSAGNIAGDGSNSAAAAAVGRKPAHVDSDGQEAADSEASDLDVDTTRLGHGLRGAAVPSLGMEDLLEDDEPWMSWPAAERDMWERVRPRALRREAAQVQALRLPASTIGRIMKLHPSLGARSSEALEVVNYATVLLLQAVARSAAKGSASQRVQFQDVRQTCLNASELQFLLPAQGAFDASALTLRAEATFADGDADGAAVEPAPPNPGAVRRGRKAGASAAGPGQGQSMLNSSLFARHAAPATLGGTTLPGTPMLPETSAPGTPVSGLPAPGAPVPAAAEATGVSGHATGGLILADAEDVPECTPEKPGEKRKLPSSSKKTPKKAPRTGSSARKPAAKTAARSSSGAAPASNGGLADFFRRSA